MRWKNDNMNSENIGRVLGIEVACRWGYEASSFIRMLPKESQIQPFFALSSHHATSALMSRWPAPITHAAAISFVAPLWLNPTNLTSARWTKFLNCHFSYRKHMSTWISSKNSLCPEAAHYESIQKPLVTHELFRNLKRGRNV